MSMSHTPPPGILIPQVREAPNPYPDLSARELEVAMMLATGNTNREIAEAMGISIKTVDTHRGHVLKKLGLRNNVALVKRMIRDGVVTP